MINEQTKVLIVDDFELVRKMFRQAFLQLGYKDIDDAGNGEEAIAKIDAAYSEGSPFGLIFLDWTMPKKSGIDVLKYCRAKEEYKELVIVMVTAEADKKSVLLALKVGASEYIVKPCSLEIMRDKIDRINQRLSA